MQVVAYARQTQGTGASRRLRNAGRTPGIIYGGSAEPQLIELDHNPLWFALLKEAFHSSVLDMELDGKAQKVLLRDVQYHPYKQLVLHVDFQRVDERTRLHMKVPLHFEGADSAPAVKTDGQVINTVTTEIDVSCMPSDLPEHIVVDLSKLAKNGVLRLRDIKLPRGVSATKRQAALNPVLATATPAPAVEEDAAPAAEE
ncbi:50S ribosomal protein L25/general stress protein Ctc [Allofranklinella schreckenbergeri]|uniref:Large ribosomal subunit protein bL25 n=1 Tax=Allofranklinella schreckenbergeri TaxID=1076744 RepID=A0A3M6Q3B8_9BURK|nr:50S ribosomal protein L25/general stress protein Ctc [Allofranklinella schreckenbergeri]MDO4705507.1 50S ribosomal protein L25/general stress protein Ctc [Comamonadaceae bacterium]RMW96921.1 50S ribosomal protein L25/general stress protein Ctc [Allofranklinella schreckenbergeri]RRD41691.1 50S ribosomal protein L25/general stress protein Ctc [Comamonadaceae bacterium OH3737_COT-264]